MRDLAIRSVVAAVVSAGVVLGGAGVAAATGPVTETTTTAPSTTEAPAPETPVDGPDLTATASVGCLGETAVVITVPDLAVGVPVDVLVDGFAPVPAVVLPGGQVVVELLGVSPEVTSLTLAVQVEDMVLPVTADLTDVCTAEGTIVLTRDCATPELVLATVAVTGLRDGPHGVVVLGTSGEQDVVLGSADVEVTGGRLTGSLPLVSLAGNVPVARFTGVALLVDGQVFASVGAADVTLAECVVPTPLPVAPPAPPAVPTTPVVPVATATTTTPAPAVANPARPAELARTGSEPGSLLLLAGVFLVVGGLTTLTARRRTR